MDDLKKQRKKRIDAITDKVVNNVNTHLDRIHLSKLQERKQELLNKIHDETRSELNRTISLSQLVDIELSIAELSAKIDLTTDIDTTVNDELAKEFIKNNPDWILDEEFDYD